MEEKIPLATEQVARINLLLLAHTLPDSVDAAAFCLTKEDEEERGRVWEKKQREGGRERNMQWEKLEIAESQVAFDEEVEKEKNVGEETECVWEEYTLKEKTFQ